MDPNWHSELISSSQPDYDSTFAWVNGLQMADLSDIDLEGIHDSQSGDGDLGTGFDEIMTNGLELAPSLGNSSSEPTMGSIGKEVDIPLYGYEQPAMTQWPTENGTFPLSTKSDDMSMEDPLPGEIPYWTLDFETLARSEIHN